MSNNSMHLLLLLSDLCAGAQTVSKVASQDPNPVPLNTDSNKPLQISLIISNNKDVKLESKPEPENKKPDSFADMLLKPPTFTEPLKEDYKSFDLKQTFIEGLTRQLKDLRENATKFGKDIDLTLDLLKKSESLSNPDLVNYHVIEITENKKPLEK